MSHDAAAAGVVMFTPLPPKPNGIADYAYEVLAGLVRVCACTAVVADDQPEAWAPEGVAVLSAAEYQLESERFAAAPHIYQLGNNPDHAYILPFLADRPGIAVLHDPTLHHLLDGVSAGNGDFAAYVDALEAEHGVAGRILGEQFRCYRLRDRRMVLDMPMTGGIAGPSRGVIVHSRFAAAKVLARAPRTTVTVVPHPYSAPAPEGLDDRPAVRRSLGIADQEILFLSLGFVARAKQIDATLRALAIARDRLLPFKYVIAGGVNEPGIDLRAEAAALGLDTVVTTLDYVDERRFFSLIAAADVVVNLRHPVAGETSGTMVRALGGGACVVMVDRGPFAEIPSDAAVHVAWGPDVEQRLGARLVELAQNGASRRRIGEAARAFIAANNRLDQTIGGYLGALDRARTHAPPRWASETVFEFLPPHRLSEAVAAARAALGRRHLPLWFEAGAVPVCDGRQPRTLVLGVDDAGLLARLGYKLDAERVPRFGARTADARDARSVDLAIILPDAALPEDPGETLAWLNRRLAFGGILVWSLASGGDAAAEPLRTQRSAMRLFEAYGFRVEATFAGSPPFIDDAPAPAPDDDATDERCWRLRKVSETFASRDLRPLEPLQVHR